MPIKPYRGASRDRLTAIINAQNRTPRVEGTDFSYGAVEEADGPMRSNTRVTLTPIPPNKFIRPVTVTYKRIPISALLLLPPTERRNIVVETAPFTTRGLIAEINLAYGLDLAATEIDNISYSEAGASLTLRILPGNYAWLPGEVQLPVTRLYNINSIIGNVLAGFDDPATLPGLDFDTLIDGLYKDQTLFVTDLLAGFGQGPRGPALEFKTLINGLKKDRTLFITETLDGFEELEL